MDIYLVLHLFLYPSIALSTHHRTCALEKLTNRKRRLLYSEGNSHGTSQRLTMELASLVFLQFQHGLKMANTLWLRGGVDHCFACLPRTQHKQSQLGLCETYLYRDFASSLPPVLFSDKIFIDIFHCSPRWFLFVCWNTLFLFQSLNCQRRQRDLNCFSFVEVEFVHEYFHSRCFFFCLSFTF